MNSNSNLAPRVLIYQENNYDGLVAHLTQEGFSVVKTTNETVLNELRKHNYDVCILGHFSSDKIGDLKLLHFLRSTDTRTPVIFLSTLNDYKYIAEAFNAGADDYVVRPYNMGMLVCKIRAILKRCGVRVRAIEPQYKIGIYTFDTYKRRLITESSTIDLTPKENDILGFLCSYKDELLPKDILLNNIWQDNNFFTQRSLDVHMYHLRNYLQQDERIEIKTFKGLGYCLTVKGENKQ